MKRFLTFAIAAAFAASMTATAWSQGGQGGGSSASGGTAGTSSTAGSAGTQGTTGTAGTSGTTGAAGTTGTATTNQAGAVGTATGVRAGNATGVNARTNAAAGANNAAVRSGVNTRANFNGISQTPFFTDPGVRRQLNMNNNQFSTLNRAYQDAYARYNQAIKNLNPNLTEQQRKQQMQKLQMQFNQEVSGNVNSTFTNPQLLARYNQLNRQFMGFNAFNDPTVQRQLNLTPDQQRQLRALSMSWRQRLQQLRRGAGNNLSAVNMDQWNQVWSQYANQLNTVLTPQQQQIWSQQIGQPYVFQPSLYDQQFGGRANGNVEATNTTPTGTEVFPFNGGVRKRRRRELRDRQTKAPSEKPYGSGTLA